MKFRSVLAMSAALSGCTAANVDEQAITVCEEKVIASLRSPSTYVRVNASVDTELLDQDDVIVFVNGSGCEIAQLNSQDCARLKRYEKLRGSEISADNKAKEAIYAEMESIQRQLWRSVASRPVDQREARTAKLEYDASNAFGAPIREETWCSIAPIRAGEKVSAKHIFWMSD